LVVETTLDLDMQRSAEEAVVNLLKEKTTGGEQGALIAMTTDGGVRAMVGGRDCALRHRLVLPRKSRNRNPSAVSRRTGDMIG
jgi:membrane carboxypeptidase/penicillin-binding protein PbpC